MATVPLRNPRTECANQPVAFISSFNEAPSGRLSIAQDLGCLAALAGIGGGVGLFGGLLAFGPPFGRAGFLPGLGLAGAIRRFRAATLARLVAFGGSSVAAAGGLAWSSAFDVMVNLSVLEDARFRAPFSPI